jgi:drug/metabolite transporter (DMT)-like permease
MHRRRVGSAVLYGAGLCAVLPHSGYGRPTNLLLVTLLMPIGAVLLGMAILGEQIDPREFGGMVLIGLGLVTIDGRLLMLFRPRLLPAVADE